MDDDARDLDAATEADRAHDERRDEERERWHRALASLATLDEWDDDASRGAMVTEARQTFFRWRER